MKAIKRSLLIAGAVVMIVTAMPSFAAKPVPVVQSFGVVDMSKVMQITSAAKDVFNQLDNRRKEYQVQISAEEEALRIAGQKIEKQRNSLSKEEFEKKRKEFKEKVDNGQKLVYSRKQILDQAFNNSMNNLRAKAADIVAVISKEKGYSVVFTKDAVMLSTPGFDMTDIVIKRLNKTVAKLPVEWPVEVSKEVPVIKSSKKK